MSKCREQDFARGDIDLAPEFYKRYTPTYTWDHYTELEPDKPSPKKSESSESSKLDNEKSAPKQANEKTALKPANEKQPSNNKEMMTFRTHIVCTKGVAFVMSYVSLKYRWIKTAYGKSFFSFSLPTSKYCLNVTTSRFKHPCLY